MFGPNSPARSAHSTGPHPGVGDHVEVVTQTLKEIGADKVPSILLLNKSDRCDEAMSANLRRKFPDAMPVSALNGTGLAEVKEAVVHRLQTATT